MSDCGCDHNHKAHKPGGQQIAWGNVIAGAAIVAGAALVAPSLFPAIGGWIAGMFTGAGAGAGVTSTVVGALTSTAARVTAGATMMALGAGYLMNKEDPSIAHRHQQLSRMNDEDFRMREDMKKMQALMELRQQAVTGAAPTAGMSR